MHGSVAAFPPGLKFLSGSATRRSMGAGGLTDNSQYGLGQRATFHSCIRDNGQAGYGT